MPEGFAVQPATLASAGHQVAVAAAALRRLRPEQALTAAARACPGGHLEGAGKAAAAKWGKSLRGAAGDLQRTADALSAGGSRYERSDENALGRRGVPR